MQNVKHSSAIGFCMVLIYLKDNRRKLSITLLRKKLSANRCENHWVILNTLFRLNKATEQCL